ncbi:hypothetical protein [Bacillus sp. ISL-55]|uniref:hypothetical protein n=1 Tax=Bacillus sp. ISL-55 TaxID=2819134 RepID=UPI001BECFF22|nr:hypothetical protein [Bacillus sp. ISL-55]MBT2691875.1 hypothetical protein [Bacillus sp. ISL-55]
MTALAHAPEKLSRKRRNRDNFGPITGKLSRKRGNRDNFGPITGKAVKKTRES